MTRRIAERLLQLVKHLPGVPLLTAIPGGRRHTQIEENARTSDLPPLSPALHAQLDALYEQHAKPRVHHLW